MRIVIACLSFVALLFPAPAMAKHSSSFWNRGGESCIAGRLPPAQRWRGASVRCVRAALAD